MSAVRRSHDISAIFTIGSGPYRSLLRGLGYGKWDEIPGLDPAEAVAHFWDRGYSIGEATVLRWKLHAKAYIEQEAALAERRRPLSDLGSYVALDLEYDPTGEIFLFGAARRDGDQTSHC